MENFIIENNVLVKYLGKDKIIKLPNVKKIGTDCFNGSLIEGIIFNEYIEEIDDYAFKKCVNLKEIIFPKSLNRIGRFSFSDCTNLKKVYFNQNLKIIDEYSFQRCFNLEKLNIPNINTLKKGVFYNCNNLKNVFLNGVKEIEEFAFYKCEKLKKINLEDFEIDFIKQSAFSFCGFKKIYLNNIKKIYREAFSSNLNLKQIKIGKNVNEIEDVVFVNCKSLQKFIVDKDNISYSSYNDSLYNKDLTNIISYPIGLKNSKFEDENVLKLSECCFFNAKYLEKIDLVNVKEIGFEAFSNCSNLKHVSSNIKIKSDYFIGCKYLTGNNIF